MCSVPLSGVRVLDLTHYVAGPYCTKLFADLGADVIKIEKPGSGDGARWLHHVISDKPDPEKNPLFLYLNTNKRSVTLDLKTTEGIRIFKELVSQTDILMENFRPGVMSRLGVDYGTLERLNPRLVMTSISNFGQDGPYRDWLATELTLNALSGMMLMTGRDDREPVKLGLSQVQYTAGVAAAVATLTAYFQRQRSGCGQHIDVSVIEPMFNTLFQQVCRYSYQGLVQARMPGTIPFFWQTEDGWMHASVLQLDGMINFLSTLVPGLDASKFKDPTGWLEHFGEFVSLAEDWFHERSKFEAALEGQMQGLMWAPVHTEADLLDSPQFKARGYFVKIDHPVAGRGWYPGLCFLSEQIEGLETRPAPLLGQHTEEVLGELRREPPGPSAQANSRTSFTYQRNGPDRLKTTMPLAGIRILSLEHWAALPQTTKYLAGLGAEVITAESANHPHPDPRNGPLFNESGRQKLSIALDLSKPRGIDLFKRLVKVSDVVVDNFTPRVMKNFGLEYESLREVKRNIIVLSLSGFGHKGPWYLYRGYAVTAEAASGLSNFTGYADGPPERPGGTPFGDIIPALHAAWAILVALEHRNCTGEGAFIDISMLEPCTCQMGEAIVNSSLTGRTTPRMGNRDPNAVPSGCYPCQGQDKWVTIAASTEAQWQALATVLGNPPWATDDRFRTKELRLEHQDELDSYISEWTLARDNMEVMKLCQEAGVPAGAVLHVREVMTNEHYRQRGAFEVVQCPPPPDGVGNRLHVAPPWKLSKTPASTSRPAPATLGQDNDYVYRQLLGLTDDEFSELETEGAIGTVITRAVEASAPLSTLTPEHDENYLEILGLE